MRTSTLSSCSFRMSRVCSSGEAPSLASVSTMVRVLGPDANASCATPPSAAQSRRDACSLLSRRRSYCVAVLATAWADRQTCYTTCASPVQVQAPKGSDSDTRLYSTKNR